MPNIEVEIEERADGWLAIVIVREDTSSTTHAVTITQDAYTRLAPDADVDALARASFEFLLEREAKESILSQFNIEVIGRYFPEYPREIARALDRG